MPDLRPEMSRLFENIQSSFSSGLQNVNTSIRTFGNSCRSQLSSRFGVLQPNTNDNGSLNSSNPFIDSNDTDQSVPSSPTIPNSNNNGCGTFPSTENNSSNSQNNNSHRSSHHQRNSYRSSNRARHHSSSCRDREYRNAYHLHRNGLISVRSLDKDNRNILAAILSIIVIIILANALAQPKWFSIYNDLCAPRYFGKSENGKFSNDDSPSIFDFQPNQYTQYRPQYYYNGPLPSVYSTTYALAPVTIYGLTPDYKTCANPQILALKRTIIGLCFLAIMCTLVQFFMDIMGTKKKWVNTMRSYAIGNILCVLFCVIIIGLSYFISVLYERVQLQQLFSKTNVPNMPSRSNSMWIKNGINRIWNDNQLDYLTIHQIEVKFELCYYLVTLAGFLSIIASAANLFRRPRQIFIERISEMNNCRTRSQMRALNGDENFLLGSDVLNNSRSIDSTPSPNHPYLPPYPYSNNDWLFNPNWSLFYNSSMNPLAANHHGISTTTAASNQNSNQPQRQTSTRNIVPTMPTTANACPPPPPYSP